MKKVLVLLAAFAVLVSCSRPKYSGSRGEKTQKDAEAEFVASLSKSDEEALLALADDCMSKFQAGRVDEALDMIYVLYNNVVYKKSASYTAELLQRFKMFPVLSFERLYHSFSTEGNNDISYSYVFAPASSGQSAQTMKLMFNPVYVDGQWYLTFKDGSQSSLDLPVDKQVHELAPAPDAPRLNKRSR
jgi:hypothetical protein